MGLEGGRLVSSDWDGHLCLFELARAKLQTLPFVQDDEFLVQTLKVKISSEPIWRVLLFLEADSIICGMPTSVRVLKIVRKNQKIKLGCAKIFSSSSSSFGHAELLLSGHVHQMQAQLESEDSTIVCYTIVCYDIL